MVRTHPWGQSALGPIDCWPPELLTLVNLMLASREIMTLFWGQDRLMIYNDCYATQLGTRHPLLSRPLREVWPEVVESVEPRIELAFREGRSSYLDDSPLTVMEDGVLTQRYYVASFEPVWVRRGDTMTVEGVFQTAFNNTEKIVAQRRLLASESRFETLVDRASVGINIGDAHGALTYINPALLSLLGYTKEEVGRGEIRWDQLTPPRYAEADQNALRQLRETGTALPYEKTYRAKRWTPGVCSAWRKPHSSIERRQ